MISVCFQPDVTQLVKGRISKKKLDAWDFQEFEGSCYELLHNIDNYGTPEDAANDLTDFFQEISQIMGKQRNDAYIVLPDCLFSVVDCFRFENEKELEKQIELNSGKSIESLYYAIPIRTTPAPQEEWVTVFAIEKRIIDCIVTAAKASHMRLISIEPASICFLRSVGIFNKEAFLYFCGDNIATLVGYSPLAGLFKMDSIEISNKAMEKMNPKDRETLLNTVITQFETAASMTFEFMNIGIPFTVLSYGDVPIKEERTVKHLSFTENVEIEDKHIGKQIDWMCAVGTMLQEQDMVSTDEYQENIDHYMKVSAGNVLPTDIKNSTRNSQILHRVRQICGIGSAILGVILVGEITGTAMLSSVEVPANLQSEYKEAQENIEKLNKESSVISLREKEHQYPLEALSALLKNKPANIYLLSVEVSSNEKEWIKIKAVAPEHLAFQDYLNILSDVPIFDNVVVTQMLSKEEDGMKTAEYTIGKAKAEK